MIQINLSDEQARQIYTILLHSAPNNNASREAVAQIENQLIPRSTELWSLKNWKLNISGKQIKEC